ncbi:MAG: glucose-6-phosphate dehydrogenase [Calothrix sp. CSU_2_0]|nr:glucose-6-phosphate dehydrogenase [Calothrix sp. CSU_2_0]
MTDFAKADLPESVDTLEKLVVWAGSALHAINKTVTAVEGVGSPVRAAQFGVYSVDSTNVNRVILRQSLEVGETYAIDKKPIWENVNILSLDAIPSQFLPAP